MRILFWKTRVRFGGSAPPAWTSHPSPEILNWDTQCDGPTMGTAGPVVSIRSLGAERPRALLSQRQPDDARNYDVSSDGARFLMIRREESGRPQQQQLNVVLNWLEELKRLDPNR